ncbi:hypothetical protein ACH0BO_11080 [Brevibacterium luteolum]|uniref:hypothetical protein n=1 Tax=Brevibacterium luteolum TaxID=199591 RepID=UPI00387A1012
MKISALVSAAAGSALLLAGCSGVAPEPEPESEKAVVDAYFTAFASGDPAEIENAADTAVEDSTAARYLAHQLNVARANNANGLDHRSSDVEVADDAVSVCQHGRCTDYADFTFEDGKLSDFSANGTSVGERLVIGGGKMVTSHDIAGFEVLSAAQSADDEQLLVVVIRFHSYDRSIEPVTSAVYRNPGGEQVDHGLNSVLPRRLLPDSHQLGFVGFPRSEIGGEIVVEFRTEDDQEAIRDSARVPVAQD